MFAAPTVGVTLKITVGFIVRYVHSHPDNTSCIKLQSGEKPRWFGDKSFRKSQQKIRLDDRNADFSWRDRLVVRCSHRLKTAAMRAENNAERASSKWTLPERQGRSVVPYTVLPESASYKDDLFNEGRVHIMPMAQLRAGSTYTKISRTRSSPFRGPPRREVLRLQVLDEYSRTRNRNKLSPKQIQSRVLAQERSQARWLNYHANGVVTSAKCQKKGKPSPSGEVLPCSDCNKILRLKIFKNALRKPAPAPRKAKFTPWSYRNPVVGEAYLRHEDVQELMEMVSP
ncbi:hypothetical protein TRAPUB_192 [Trametes pubescens]|uniref:Uncharacterized protein n=1 Tax=Trametes pubescens TaxID=154538 RepID=A0A1M2VMT1_TRAPU|nr:hypothetical protein TRAPUB_192 [Trametes pubescens]